MSSKIPTPIGSSRGDAKPQADSPVIETEAKAESPDTAPQFSIFEVFMKDYLDEINERLRSQEVKNTYVQNKLEDAIDNLGKELISVLRERNSSRSPPHKRSGNQTPANIASNSIDESSPDQPGSDNASDPDHDAVTIRMSKFNKVPGQSQEEVIPANIFQHPKQVISQDVRSSFQDRARNFDPPVLSKQTENYLDTQHRRSFENVHFKSEPPPRVQPLQTSDLNATPPQSTFLPKQPPPTSRYPTSQEDTNAEYVTARNHIGPTDSSTPHYASPATRFSDSKMQSIIDAPNDPGMKQAAAHTVYNERVVSSDHILLTSLDADKVLKFFKKFQEYEETHSYLLKMHSKIHVSVKKILIQAHYPGYSTLDFNTLSRTQIVTSLKNSCQPRSAQELHDFMQKFVQHDPVKLKALTCIQDWKAFNEEMINYIHEFDYNYSFFSDGMQYSLPLTNKKGGFIFLFMANIHEGFACNLWHEIMPVTGIFASVSTFFEAVQVFLRKQTISYHTSMRLHDSFQSLVPAKPKTTFSKPFVNFQASSLPGKAKFNAASSSRFRDYPSSYVPKMSSSKPIPRYGALNNMERTNSSYYPDIEAYYEATFQRRQSQSQDDEDEKNEQDFEMDYEYDECNDMPCPEPEYFEDYQEEEDNEEMVNHPQLSVMQQPRNMSNMNINDKVKMNPTKFCHQKLLQGKCTKPLGTCPFAHDGKIMDEAVAMLAKSLQDPKHPCSSAKIEKTLQNTQMISTPRPYPKLSMMGAAPSSYFSPKVMNPTPNQEWLQGFYLQQQQQLLNHNPLLRRRIRVIIPGEIQIPGTNTFIALPDVLFDSGAIESSYLSRKFLANCPQLASRLHEIKDPFSVTLADAEHEVDITHNMRTTCRFPYTGCGDNVVSCANINLNVTNIGYDMIIGLPDILQHFLGMYIHMLTAPELEDQLNDLTIQKWPGISAALSSTSGKTFQPYEVTEGVQTLPPTLSPWSAPPTPDAPEDLNTPAPCAFTEALNYLDKPMSELFSEFEGLFDEHVEAEFARTTDILKLLREEGKDVFIPTNWEGIKGVPPVTINWNEDLLPKSIKPPARNVNPKILANAKSEFERLKKYFYHPSSSPIASPLVIAPKATAPFIRFCGDYVKVNKYILSGHPPIPIILLILYIIIKFSIFLDFDLINAFHQFLIDLKSSERLSVQTPWGQYRPKFMPEGIPPASGELQKAMDIIFEPIKEYSIVVFDNLLVLATDYQDAYNKCKTVFDICKKHNLYLKFSKSWLGFKQVKFFGYQCSQNTYQLDDERKSTLMAKEFPTSKKHMQSFLGNALFFRNFLPHYSSMTAPLYNMTTSDFVWKPDDWRVDYSGLFKEFKNELVKSQALHYPDVSLPWVLRTDASLLGVGAILFQIAPTGEYQQTTQTPTPSRSPETQLDFVCQALAFLSQKFSDAATRWTTIEQEAYGLYYSVHKLQHLLRGKHFTLETDHANLQWMESSEVPKIIRWRIFLQSFDFTLRHIPGKDNKVADYLSRYFGESEKPPQSEEQLGETTIVEESWDTKSEHLPSLSSFYDTRRPTRENRKRPERFRSNDPPTDVTSSEDLTCLPDFQRPRFEQSDLIDVVTVQPPDVLAQAGAPNPLLNDEPRIVLDNEPFQAAVVPYHNNPKLEIFRQVHNARHGHRGVRRTWQQLNACFKNHCISVKEIEDFIAECPVCQKERFRLSATLEPVQRALSIEHMHSTIGADTLTITPPDIHGNTILIVIVNHMTKLTFLYPGSDHTPLVVAKAFFKYFSIYGITDQLLTDPGSEFMNKVISHLTQWIGIQHTFSLVDRHESNGVEHKNHELLLILRNLCMEEVIKNRWSEDQNLCTMAYLVNSLRNSETGFSPFELHFGQDCSTYHQLPVDTPTQDQAPQFLRLLTDNLRVLQHRATSIHNNVLAQRTTLPASIATPRNTFQPGDLILFQLDPTKPRASKLSTRFRGPFKVISQSINNIECTHLSSLKNHTLHVSRVQAFFGNDKDARDMADLDYGQCAFVRILGYSGNPMNRQHMDIFIEFEGGDCLWIPFNFSLVRNELFLEYCTKHPQLNPLLAPASISVDQVKVTNNTIITSVIPEQVVFIPVRAFNEARYSNYTELGDSRFTMDYILPCTVGNWTHDSRGAHRKSINMHFPRISAQPIYVANPHWVNSYVRVTFPTNTNAVLIDEIFLLQHRSFLTLMFWGHSS